MLACIFGRAGKTASVTDAGNDSAADDADNIRWDLINPLMKRDGGKKYYRAAKARLLKEGVTRIFQMGDCVTTKTPTSAIWVGHITHFFEVLTDSGKRGTSADSFRVVVRWFYDPKDCPQDEIDRAVNAGMIRGPLSTELFFSDHVDTEGNPLECVIGKAFIRGTKQGFSETKNNPPRDYWKDSDKFFLCRAYYASSDDHPPRPIRKLEQGELAYLLQNPCTEDLYNKSLLFRRHGHKINKDLDGNPMYHKHKPVAVKKETRIAETTTDKQKVKEKKQKVKKDITEIRPMYKCRCCPERNGNGRAKAKRKSSAAGAYEEGERFEDAAVRSKRPRLANDAVEQGNVNANANGSANGDINIGSPSHRVEDLEYEPMNNENGNGNDYNGTVPMANGLGLDIDAANAGGEGDGGVKDEDDLEELPYTPPRLVGTPESAEVEGDVSIAEAPAEDTAPGYAYAEKWGKWTG